MLEITILSGKGGTGKTTFTAALASLVTPAVICDNDVDAADLFLILNPEIKEQGAFFSGWTAQINPEACNNCGLCQSLCRFNAIASTADHQLRIDPFSCEGCRLCEKACPQNAITSQPNNANLWFESSSRFGPFIYAQMEPGEENSGKLVTFIRKKAKEQALKFNIPVILNDGPPGIGCPVIASLTGTHMVLIVIEPTLSGWHDASRLIDLVKNFNIPLYAIINKVGINSEMENIIADNLQQRSIPLLGLVPYDNLFREAMIDQKNIFEYAPQSRAAQAIQTIWNRLAQLESAVDILDLKMTNLK